MSMGMVVFTQKLDRNTLELKELSSLIMTIIPLIHPHLKQKPSLKHDYSEQPLVSLPRK